MPEIKNTFLAGKMNKSLDTRLVPEGEYIDALNVQITKSDVGNVGVIQNVKGNEAITSITHSGTNHYTIGSFFDEKNNRIFWFVTDNGANNYIYMYDSYNILYTLVSGAFLNFNSANKITGVNVLEDLLFWTDNRNQPRRINVETAISSPSYYNSEPKISVAKVIPYKAPSISVSYNPAIQSRLLEDEFVRFAYRYKFSNNEYSVISPFSQIAFELYDTDKSTANNALSTDDETKIFQSAENFRMVNRANQVDLVIDLLSTNPVTDYDIVAVDILYKESDSVAVRIVDTIKITNGSSTYTYQYKSTPPKSTLPEDQVTRAFDNVPIKALAQEIAGNRVVYGNFTQNYTVPDIDFDVYCTIKDDSEYPHHSVKQRRDYEVGIVLSDRYGRTSPVILSSTSRISVPAKDENFDSLSWPGDSIKIVFNQDITGEHVYGDDGIDPDLPSDLGWYYYSVVVKQIDQEYYNVYNPGITKGYITIYNDNINKIPRSTDNSIDADDLYPSESRLYPKIINYSTLLVPQALTQKLSNEGLYSVESIGTADAFDLYDINTAGQSKGFYEQTKFHLLGKIADSTSSIYGNTIPTPFNGVLSVFETEPFRSSLDIFYETSTSGIIQELNNSNDATVGNILIEPSNFGTNTEGNILVSEAVSSGSYVARLRAIDAVSGNDIPYATFTLNSPTSQFSIEKDNIDGYYKIKTSQSFVYSSTPANNEYTLNITSSNFTSTNKKITITNAVPTIDQMGSKSISKDFYSTSTPPRTVYTLNVTNGSSDTSVNRYSGISLSDFTITEVHDGTTHTEKLFGMTYSNGQLFINSILGTTTHAGEYIYLTVTFNNGGLIATSEGVVYISTTTGGGSGLSPITLKFDLNTSQYNSANTAPASTAACANIAQFPGEGTFYVDNATSVTSATILYGTSDGTKLASSGWYCNPTAAWTGKWLKVLTGDGTYTGYWEIPPTTCTI
jgi:hypothetical protein